MAIVATGSTTIIDLSDGKSLSAYLGSNQPRTQIYDSNDRKYTPDWTTAQGKLVITPVVYANQTAIALSDAALSIAWKRKDGSGSEANLVTGETVAGNILTVNKNALGDSASKLITYVAYVTYNDPDTGMPVNAMTDISFALVQTGANAKSCWISGEQVFKYDSTNEPTPGQIMLTANLQHCSVSKWMFRAEGGLWQDYPTTADNATISGTTIIVKPTHAVWVGDMATIKVATDDGSVEDVMTIYKVRDGLDGTIGSSAPMAFLTNESIQFVGNESGQVAATTKTCNVVSYHGTEKVTPTVGAITGAPAGMTVEVLVSVNHEVPIKITITDKATLGGVGQQQGVLSIPVTSPVVTTYQLQWSKVNSGAQGSAGESAVVFSLFAPQGTVFVNHGGTLPIEVSAYHGSTAISSGATYAWSKYESGAWKPLSETGSSITVNGSDVPGTASYRCQMTYDGKTYQDVISLTDKSDNIQATIDSTAGTIFKNAKGETILICRLWQGGTEIDEMRSTNCSDTGTGDPDVGDYFYKTSTTSPEMKLMRWNGTVWEDVTANATYKHDHDYTWYRRDKNGEPMDNGARFAKGKAILVTDKHVDSKTVFTCEVE